MPKQDDRFLKESALLNADPKVVLENTRRMIKAYVEAKPEERKQKMTEELRRIRAELKNRK